MTEEKLSLDPLRNIELEKEKLNWLINEVFIRGENEKCMKLCDEQIKLCDGFCEFPNYIKGLLLRAEGKIFLSLKKFQKCIALDPFNSVYIKQVGRSYYLLGKFKEALELYSRAQKIVSYDWEIWHNKGLCYLALKNYPKAEDSFLRANAIEKHDETFMELGKLYKSQKRNQKAVDIYLEGIEHSPENPEFATTLGLLYLRLGENFNAFNYLGNSLTLDPKNPRTILAAGSIMQDHSETDVALNKYRVAIKQLPNCSQLWNNIGICFFGKQNAIAAIVCLKRALYLSPFEWTISYNLGLVHLQTKQYASAFHYLSNSISLKQDFAMSYMYLGITLARLDDFENACNSYEKAIKMDPKNHLFHLNYALTLFKFKKFDKSKKHYLIFEENFKVLDEETKQNEKIARKKADLLLESLT